MAIASASSGLYDRLVVIVSAGNWIAIAAVTVSLLVAAYSARQTRRLVREDRLQARLADTYVTLTDYALRTQQYALTAMSDVSDDDPFRDPPFENEQWLSLRARVFAFASNDVKNLFQEVLLARAWTQTALKAWKDALAAAPSLSYQQRQANLGLREDLATARAALATHCEAVVERVRKELNPGRAMGRGIRRRPKRRPA